MHAEQGTAVEARPAEGVARLAVVDRTQPGGDERPPVGVTGIHIERKVVAAHFAAGVDRLVEGHRIVSSWISGDVTVAQHDGVRIGRLQDGLDTPPGRTVLHALRGHIHDGLETAVLAGRVDLVDDGGLGGRSRGLIDIAAAGQPGQTAQHQDRDGDESLHD